MQLQITSVSYVCYREEEDLTSVINEANSIPFPQNFLFLIYHPRIVHGLFNSLNWKQEEYGKKSWDFRYLFLWEKKH